MPPFGHIKLGFAGDLREYVLVDPDSYTESLVNPMGVKTTTGAGSYDSYEGWAHWVQEGWSLGVGTDPKEPGGFEFGEIDSRYTERLFLLPRIWPTNTKTRDDSSSTWNHPGNYEYEFKCGPSEEYTSIAIPLGIFSSDIENVWIYQCYDDSLTTDVELWTGASWPTAQVATATLTGDSTTRRSGYRYGAFSPAITGNGASNYWLVVTPTTTATFPANTGSFPASTSLKIYQSGAWRDVAGGSIYRPFFLTDVDRLPATVTAASTFNGEFYVGLSDGKIYKRTGADDEEYYTLVDTAAAGILQFIEWWDQLIIIEDGSAAEAMSTGEVLSTLSFTAQIATIHRGYFWYGTDNQAFYDSTQTLNTPSTATLDFFPGNEKIRGMAGLADNIIISTDSALWNITPGDLIEGISKWDYPSEDHGKGMIYREGSIFIPYGDALLRYSDNVPISNVWIRDVPLPTSRTGDIVDLLTTNKELIMLLNSDGQSTAWSWNYQGWHCIAVFPPGVSLTKAVYDYSSTRIYYLTEQGITFWSLAARTDQIATFQTGTQFEPDAWMDTGEYFADLYTVEKDIESIQIFGNDISTTTPVTIFWKDDDSTDWERLGTISGPGQLIRWNDPDTRPATLGIRLGLLLRTSNEALSPEIKAIVMRHYPTITDRWQYRMPLILSPKGAGLGGKVNTREVDDMKDHLDTLVGATPPVRLVGYDGLEREVKIPNAVKRPSGYEVMSDGETIKFDIVYDVTVEAILGQDYIVPDEVEIPDPVVPPLSFIVIFEFDDAVNSGYLPALVPFV